MTVTTQLDALGRGIFPPPFEAGDVLQAEQVNSDSITFRLVRPSQGTEVKARKVKGKWVGAKVPLRPEVIAAAVRADRDSR